MNTTEKLQTELRQHQCLLIQSVRREGILEVEVELLTKVKNKLKTALEGYMKEPVTKAGNPVAALAKEAFEEAIKLEAALAAMKGKNITESH